MIRRAQAVEMATDLADEAQLRMDEWCRPQQGVDIPRERGKHSSKSMLMKNGDCNRRETLRVGEPPKKFQIRWNQICKETARASNRTEQLSPKRNVGVSRDVVRNGAPGRRTCIHGGNKL